MNLAILASFAATCHRNNVNFSKWLNRILLDLSNTPTSQTANLLPNAKHDFWKFVLMFFDISLKKRKKMLH